MNAVANILYENNQSNIIYSYGLCMLYIVIWSIVNQSKH